MPEERVDLAHVKQLIASLTGQANMLVTPRVFVEMTGDHLAALLLCQIVYWSERATDPDGWFFKTDDEWADELVMSSFQVRRARQLIGPFGVQWKVRKVGTTPKMHYRIDGATFYASILKFLESQETRKSRNLHADFQETSKSMDFQETSKSSIQRSPKTTNKKREGTRGAKRADAPPPTAAKTNQGTRFTLSNLPIEWRAYCEQQRPDLDPDRVWQNFSDYWTAKVGASARKLDWLATWRRWVREEKRGGSASREQQAQATTATDRQRYTLRQQLWMDAHQQDAHIGGTIQIVRRNNGMTDAERRKLTQAGMPA